MIAGNGGSLAVGKSSPFRGDVLALRARVILQLVGENQLRGDDVRSPPGHSEFQPAFRGVEQPREQWSPGQPEPARRQRRQPHFQARRISARQITGRARLQPHPATTADGLRDGAGPAHRCADRVAFGENTYWASRGTLVHGTSITERCSTRDRQPARMLSVRPAGQGESTRRRNHLNGLRRTPGLLREELVALAGSASTT